MVVVKKTPKYHCKHGMMKKKTLVHLTLLFIKYYSHIWYQGLHPGVLLEFLNVQNHHHAFRSRARERIRARINIVFHPKGTYNIDLTRFAPCISNQEASHAYPKNPFRRQLVSGGRHIM